jgi:hypothetical protein
MILYHGPSMIDGAEIVAIATDASANSKTGAMAQVWILRADAAPQAASRDGRDVSICGDCPHRFNPETGKRTCYVTVFQAPRSVYAAWQRGRYGRATTPAARRAYGAGKRIRLSAYGDPAAVPAHVWEQLLTDADGWTGYTHQWAHRDAMVRANAAKLRPYVMASADSTADHAAATSAGWRTFRVRTAGAPLLERERVCPASTEAGARTTCAACRACSGTAGRGHSNIAIVIHGAQARAFAEVA